MALLGFDPEMLKNLLRPRVPGEYVCTKCRREVLESQTRHPDMEEILSDIGPIPIYHWVNDAEPKCGPVLVVRRSYYEDDPVPPRLPDLV